MNSHVGMLTIGLTVTVGLSVMVAAQRGADSAPVLLRQAIDREVIDGDTAGAIRLYEAIVNRFAAADGATAAEALLRMGDAYRRMGDVLLARQAYERVVREFARYEPLVRAARDRTSQPTGRAADGVRASRLVWTLPPGGEVFGNVSANGSFGAYVDWDRRGDLFLHDFRTGRDRPLTAEGTDGVADVENQFGEAHAFSRDEEQIAYAWFRGSTGRFTLRVRRISGTAPGPYTELLDNPDIAALSPLDWSPDGSWIALNLQRADTSSQIALVSPADGRVKVLKTGGWRGTTNLFFSGDGRYLAYDAPADEASEQRDVHVLTADGSADITVAAGDSDDQVVGWDDGGTRVVFLSDRSGAWGLWSVPVHEGRQSGPPARIGDAGITGAARGASAPGTIYIALSHGRDREVRIGHLDASTGHLEGTPETAARRFLGRNFSPAWSPDGRELAYLSLRGAGASRYLVVGIRSAETGAVREVVPSPNFRYLNTGLSWSADGRALVAAGRDARGRGGIFRIDIESGRVITIMPAISWCCPQQAVEPHLDGSIFFRRPVSRDGVLETALSRFDPSTEREVELIRQPSLGQFILSPDGRAMATTTDRGRRLLLVPTSGEDARELLGDRDRILSLKAWSPDSRSVLVAAEEAASGVRTMLRVGLDGRSVPIAPDLAAVAGRIQLQPGGAAVAFDVTGDYVRPVEVWALEGFLTRGDPGR